MPSISLNGYKQPGANSSRLFYFRERRGGRITASATCCAMVGSSFFMGLLPGYLRTSQIAKNKKTDVVKYPKAFNHVGLLVNKPPGRAELLFI